MLYFNIEDLRVKEEDIRMMLNHNDVKANFYSVPPEADIQLGNIIALNFTAKDLSEMNAGGSFEDSLVKSITNKLNNYRSEVREAIVSEIRLLNLTTEKFINEYRNDAYAKYCEIYPNLKSRDDFLSADYKNTELLVSLIGQRKTDYLLLRDPLINDTAGFGKENPFNMKSNTQIIKDTVKTISQLYTADNYSVEAGRIMVEIGNAAPEDIFERAREEGTGFLEEKIDNMSDTEIQTVMTIVNQIDFDEIFRENLEEYDLDYV